MGLSGYTKTSDRKNGGVRTLALVSVSDFIRATYNSSEGVFTEIVLREGAAWARYEFKEDEAEYTESISLPNGSMVVNHQLKFMLEKMGDETAPLITELGEASNNGIIGVVITPNGDSFLVGYSETFGIERPLRVHAVTGTTGKQLKDVTCEIITLQSQDISKSKPYRGVLE